MEEKTKRQAKAFNQINFNINDAFGREATKRLFFRRWGIRLKDSKDKFGIDLFGLHNDTKLYVECSVNNTKGWVNNTFYTQNKTGTCFAICKITHDILTLPLEPYKQRPVSTNETVGEEEALLINKKHFRFYEI